MEEKYSIELTYLSDTDQLISFVLPRANKELSMAEVTTAMNAIVTSGIVVTGQGRPWFVEKAEFIKTVTISYELS